MQNGEFDKNADPGIAVFYEGKIGEDRGFRFQTVMPRDCTPQELGSIVDRFRIEADRQQAFFSIDAHTANIEKETKLLQNVEADIRRISEQNVIEWRNRGKLGNPKLSPRESDSLANLNSSLVAKQNEIKRWQAALEIAKRKIGYAT